MKKIFFLFHLLLISIVFVGQNYEITFVPDGISDVIDSVLVENIDQNTSLVMGGSDILHLIGPSDIQVSPLSVQGDMFIYPNPMNESAVIEFVNYQSDNVLIQIFDISGKLVIHYSGLLNVGKYKFELSGLKAGIYSVVVRTKMWQNTAKLLSTGECTNDTEIKEIGYEDIMFEQGDLFSTKSSEISGAKSTVTMQYVDGEVLVFTAYSGVHATVSALIPTQSQTVVKNFVSCIDPNDYSYSIIEFGDQIWMAENLRYDNGCSEIQWVDSLDSGWCGYYDGNIDNLEEYGLLYQWSVSNNVCPIGWKLPSDSDWADLEEFLGMSADEVFTIGLRGVDQGAKLAGTPLWQVGPLVENEEFGNTGFNSKPAGERHFSGSFNFIGSSEKFWSSTEYSSTQAYYRSLNYGTPKIGRYYYSGKSMGLSVRCVKDNSVLTEYPIVETIEVANITQNSCEISGDVISQGTTYVEDRGFVWSTESEPNLITNEQILNIGYGAGYFNGSISGLEMGTTYYVRAFAINSTDTAYGDILSFETLDIPTIQTIEIVNISSFQAVAGGNVISDGGTIVTNRGLVWDIVSNPTIDINIGITNNESGLGEFSSEIEIAPNTTYYLRAYATNAVGVAYGNEITFTTLQIEDCGIVEYDNRTYNTIVFGDHCWFAENLSYLPQVCNSDDKSDTIPKYYVYNYYGVDVEEAKLTNNYSNYGVLYNWRAAITACPEGWHLPCDAEWTELEMILGLAPEDSLAYGIRGEHVGSKLAGESELWNDGVLKADEFFGISEFNALPGGRITLYSDTFDGINICGLWWNDTKNDNAVGYRYIGYSIEGVIRSETSGICGHSVRCVKDEVTTELPVVTTLEVESITQHTVVSGGNVLTNSGSPILARGVVYSQSENPSLLVNDGLTSEGNYTGNFTSNLVDLLPGTIYYARAYVTNANGTGYGEQVIFETLDLQVPDVQTTEIISIDIYSAQSGGVVTNDQGAEVMARGVVWSTSSNPTIELNSGLSINGAGLGEFVSELVDLSDETTYYVRAYATNSVGTGYGEELSFETLPMVPPTIITSPVIYITQTTAISGGDVVDDGGSDVIDRGVVWGLSTSPTIVSNDGILHYGTGLGTFIAEVEPLLTNQVYYLRAFATNSIGTSYGVEIEFSTLDSGEDGQPCVGMDSVLYESYYYQTVQHGSQCWFAENLKYMPEVSQEDLNDSIPFYYVFGYNGDDLAEAMSSSNYNMYGVQYNIPAANIACPDGWRLPSDEDWKVLESSLGMTEIQTNITGYRGTYEGSKLAGNEEIWVDGLLDADIRFGESNFNAIPMNPYNDYAIWWTSSNDTVLTDEYFYRKLENTTTRVYRDLQGGSARYSVRCVKDMFTPNVPVVNTVEYNEVTDTSVMAGGYVEFDGGADLISRGVVCGLEPSPTIGNNIGIVYNGTGLGEYDCVINDLEPGTIYYLRAFAINSVGIGYGENFCNGTQPIPIVLPACENFETVDYGGYTYNTVMIGEQCWMAENLKYLPEAPSPYYISYSSPMYYVYDYDGESISESMQTENYQQYGVLYNWYAAMNGVDPEDTYNYPYQGICPEGWHIPSNSEFMTLRDYLGGYFEAGGQLKEQSTEHWTCPNVGGTNESLFTALPAGYLYADGFEELNEFGGWWESNFTDFYSTNARVFSVEHDSEIMYSTYTIKKKAVSVRCIRNIDLPDVTTLNFENVSQTIATMTGSVDFNGGSPITDHGIIWSLTDSISLDSYDGICQLGEGEGQFSCDFSGLSYGTVYYYRAFASNVEGTAYGEVISFTTNPQASLPIVEMVDVTDISSNLAVIHGDLIDDGGEPETQTGFVWSTSSNPTVDENEGIVYVAQGEGGFNDTLVDLFCNTTYYVNAFAINTGGTSYGVEMSFTMENVPACLPVFYDGYTYNTIQIGCQCWFEENLKYLPKVFPRTYNGNVDSLRYYVYDNNSYDVEVAKSTECYNTYGVLYGKETMLSACPDGWKVPSDNDWKILELYLGMSEDVVDEYFERGTNEGSKLAGADSLWNYSYITLDPEFNTSGFNALPGGYRDNSASGLGNYSYFWTSTIDPDYEGRYLYRRLYKSRTTINRFNNEGDCYSIRCLKDLSISDTLPLVETISISSITTESAILLGEVLDNLGEEALERGFVWNTSGNPDIANHDGIAYSGYGDGEFISEIQGLAEGSTYYVKAFATNGLGTSYGTQLMFVVNSDALPPSVSIVQVSDIDPISFVVESNVDSEGGSAVTERGLIWSKTNNPTIADNLGNIANGSGLGSFITSVESLEDTTVYYVRAYAINSNGISYSNQFVVVTDTFENCGTYEFDDHLYHSVVIGNQCWFTEDLNSADYEWDEAYIACPIGWKLPSDDDWNELEIELGMNPSDALIVGYRAWDVGGKLASDSDLWAQDSLVNCMEFGSSGFRARPRSNGGFYVSWWTETLNENYSNTYYGRRIYSNSTGVYRFSSYYSNDMYVRCIRDTSVNLLLPEVNTVTFSDVTQTTVKLYGELMFEGLPEAIEKGFVVSSDPDPTLTNYDGILSLDPTLGTFDGVIIGLQPSTQYYYRAYAKNMIGVSYGDEYAFTTPVAADLPIISTDSIVDIEPTNAIVHGTLIDDGGELGDVILGIVCSSSSNPSIENCDFKTEMISGEGSFSDLIFDLEEQNTYYVKVYAQNSTGITYGEELSFSTIPFPRCGTIGYQGHYYKTISIGSQCWMAENMRYIPEITSTNDWGNNISEHAVYGYSGYSIDDAMSSFYYDDYGALYNWHAALEICPTGWHLPSDEEFQTLELELDMPIEQVDLLGNRGTTQASQLAGGIDLWTISDYQNLDKTNDFASSGFDCLPGGFIDVDGDDDEVTDRALIWTSTIDPLDGTESYYRFIDESNTTVYRNSEDITVGMSVRCIRDVGFVGMEPTVYTEEASNMFFSADWEVQLGGNVVYDGCDSIIERGVVWSTTENPTITVNEGIIYDNYEIGHFDVTLTGLSSDLQYYYRAFAVNSSGTTYGLQLSFITSEIVDGQPCPTSPYVVDRRDSIEYNTIIFDSICWFVENLRYLPEVVGPSDESTIAPRFYVYDYEGVDVNEAKQTENYQKYGALYNWNAAMKACPSNWDVPSDDYWKELEVKYGMSYADANDVLWRGTNQGSILAGLLSFWNNGVLVDDSDFGLSGFNAIPGGCQTGIGGFYSIDNNAYFWADNSSSSSTKYARYIYDDETGIWRGSRPKDCGYSVRCAKKVE